MVVDQSYRISAFGEFSDIQPTTENMLFFLNGFKDYGMVPSVFQEVKFDKNIPQPISQQRIALVSSDNTEKFSFSSNRVDFEITATDDTKLDIEKRKDINKRIESAFKIVFEQFDKKATRLALNTESVVLNLNSEQVIEFMSKYTNPISLYNNSPMDEWSTRLMIRKKEAIRNKEEVFNVITNLSKAVLQKSENGGIIQKNGFLVNVDINTIAENESKRFDILDLVDFVEISTNWWDTIIAEMD